MKSMFLLVSAAILLLLSSGCANFNIHALKDDTSPLKEFTVRKGSSDGKILLMPVRGIISDISDPGILKSNPSMVQEVVSQLKLAENDPEIKCLLLTVNSPGGTVTGSDMLFNELMNFKKKKNIKIVVCMMDVAASGGYMISLPADCIYAHPTTITGSVGVIFYQLKIHGLLDKIGVGMDVTKSGDLKDMGSPFRKSTDEEVKMFQKLIDQLDSRFLDAVKSTRKIDEGKLKEVSSGRVYLAEDALKMGLIDKIGYMDDAVQTAADLSGLGKDPEIIVYRRTRFPNDNLYNTAMEQQDGTGKILNLGVVGSLAEMQTGFYYIWAPAAGNE